MTTKNNYADDMVINISDDGMTDELWQLVHDDNATLNNLNAASDRDRNLYFYLDNFYDDLCEEFGYPKNRKDEVLTDAFIMLNRQKSVDLTDIRRAVFESLKHRKFAYPNTMGVQFNEKPQRDIAKWVQTLGEIYAAVKKGKDMISATQKITEEWSPMEKLDFDSWLRYYEHGDHEKYGMTKNAAPAYEIPSKFVITPEDMVGTPRPKRPGRPKNIERTKDEDKRSLISRLDAARRYLRSFADLWGEKWEQIDEMLTHIQRMIMPLQTHASMVDKIICTADRFEKFGFNEGAEVLRKVAQPPGDVATQIEKALKGKEYGAKGPSQDELGMEGMPPLDETMPMGEEAMPPEGDMPVPPAGVEEAMPPMETPPVAPESAPEEEISPDNPFSGKTVQDVLEVLEPVAKKLSEREFVRELAKADMILDSMNIASHFPELGEATSKALELNLYVSARIEKIINKLKGGLRGGEGKEEETPALPEVEMGEFSKEPGQEKEMFEVSEETPPAGKAPMPPAGKTPMPPAGKMPPKPGV